MWSKPHEPLQKGFLTNTDRTTNEEVEAVEEKEEKNAKQFETSIDVCAKIQRIYVQTVK